jgi:hypothetical protein
VAIPQAMLKSRAYIDLPPTARGMLPYFLWKVKIPITAPTYYFANFEFPFSEAERYGCAPRTFYRVIEALMGNGFIDPIRKGGRNGGRDTANVFRLSDRWQKYGLPDFKKMSWASFGQEQIRNLLQNWRTPVAKKSAGEEKGGKRIRQKLGGENLATAE